MKTAARTILFSQIIFYAGLAACLVLRPAGLGANNGISYYGVFRETFFPYAVALLGAAYFAVRAIDEVPAGEQFLRQSLKMYAPLIVGIVITPYAAGTWMDYLHHACGATLFSLQLALSGWLAWRLRYAWWSVTLVIIEFGAALACALYLNPTHGFLIQAQVVFQLAFGALLCLSLVKLSAAPRR